MMPLTSPPPLLPPVKYPVHISHHGAILSLFRDTSLRASDAPGSACEAHHSLRALPSAPKHIPQK